MEFCNRRSCNSLDKIALNVFTFHFKCNYEPKYHTITQRAIKLKAMYGCFYEPNFGVTALWQRARLKRSEQSDRRELRMLRALRSIRRSQEPYATTRQLSFGEPSLSLSKTQSLSLNQSLGLCLRPLCWALHPKMLYYLIFN